jgi:hypothetical protein
MRFKFDSYSAFGAVLTAAACSTFFPKLAAVGAIVGLGTLAVYEVYFLWGTQFLVLLSAVGQLIAYKDHQSAILASLAVLSAVLFFVSLHLFYSEELLYYALASIVAVSVGSMIMPRKPQHEPSRIQ